MNVICYQTLEKLKMEEATARSLMTGMITNFGNSDLGSNAGKIICHS
jgi:hypothetical protein